jgi:hypothetical protein
MMDAEDDMPLTPSALDQGRLEAMEVGDTVEAENGAWRVMRYRNDYTIILTPTERLKGHRTMHEYTRLDQLTQFLHAKEEQRTKA